MKFYTIINSGIILSLLFLPIKVNALTIVDPGTMSSALQAEQCAHNSRGLFGGDCTVDCNNSCDISQNLARASIHLGSGDLGYRFITQTIYTEFQVSSDSSNVGNTVTSALSYDVGWLGWWSYGAAFFDSEPAVTITLWVTDRTTGQPIMDQLLHRLDVDTWASIDIINLGVGRDKDSITAQSQLNLVRGHTYRVHLTIKLEATGYSSSELNIDYFDDFGNKRGVWWNTLAVTINKDLTERVDLLEGRVQVLEEKLEGLRYDLNTHTHIYQTGRGEGHNKVDTNSSMAVMDTSEPSINFATESIDLSANAEVEQKLPLETITAESSLDATKTKSVLELEEGNQNNRNGGALYALLLIVLFGFILARIK